MDAKLLILMLSTLILLLILRLLCYRRALSELARTLEETGADSNLPASSSLLSRPLTRFLMAVNKRLREGREAQLRLRREQEAHKMMITSVSHDIRTPLTGALGYLQLLEGCTDTDKNKRYTTVITAKLEELSRLLDELFLYTKLGNEEYTVLSETVNPYDVLCVTAAEFFTAFEEKGTKPVLDFASPSLLVSADCASLKRIYANLIDNALKHGTGNLLIRQNGSSIIFVNKVVVLPDAARLFDRFYKADQARMEKSTGLGLPIVMELMRKMGGSAEASLEGDLLSVTLEFVKAAAP